MRRLVFGTRNPGKIDDARQFLKPNLVELVTLDDLGIDVDPEETGETFEENAWIKYNTLRPLIPDDIILVTDDAGIMIDALDGEPGVHTRRWKGYSMTDQEILDYCLEQMADKSDRRARFVMATIIGGTGIKPQVLTGSLQGELLTSPVKAAYQAGYPFRSIFSVPELGRMLYEIHALPPHKRGDFLTHREQVWRDINSLLQALPA